MLSHKNEKCAVTDVAMSICKQHTILFFHLSIPIRLF